MDNDTSTMAKIHAETDPNLKKRPDAGHTRKNVMGSLIKLGEKHKPLRSSKTKEYLVAMAMIAIRSNEGNADAIRSALDAIPKHVYGKLCSMPILLFKCFKMYCRI